MRSFRANPANSHYPTRIHPALSSFADECCGMLARLVAYVGALALLAIVGVHLWDELPDGAALEPSAKADWSAASRACPAFAVSAFDLPDKTGTYEIFRHPEGGRKDVFRWSAQGESRSPSSKSIARAPCFALPATPAARVPALASSSASTNPICGSPAGHVRATPWRSGARRFPACLAGWSC